jgi:hypothetical protein
MSEGQLQYAITAIAFVLLIMGSTLVLPEPNLEQLTETKDERS